MGYVLRYIITATAHNSTWQDILLSIESSEATSADLWALGSG